MKIGMLMEMPISVIEVYTIRERTMQPCSCYVYRHLALFDSCLLERFKINDHKDDTMILNAMTM